MTQQSTHNHHGDKVGEVKDVVLDSFLGIRLCGHQVGL